jgi:GNAT superfamily N-acetyltransferase
MVLPTQKSTIVRTYSPCRQVEVEVLDRADAGAAVDAVFAGLSAHSRYLRFHSPIPRLPPSVRARLVDVDGHRHLAMVARACGVPVGIARVIGSGSGPPGSGDPADLAVAVVDAWQRRGVGTRLLTAVTALAEELGYRELRGAVVPENVAMQGLARKIAPWLRAHWDGEVVQLTVPLGAAAWTVTHEDLMADLAGR